MAKTEVRVTLFAEPIEVDEDEIPNLRSQGLLVEDTPASSGPDSSAGRGKRGTTPAGDGTPAE